MSYYSSAEALNNLFEPDVVLPSQFNLSNFAGIAGGERKLMAALLSDGIEAYIIQVTNPRPNTRSKKVDACEWVEKRDFSYVFSFDNVCECLGIDPEYLRLGLTRYVDAARSERAGCCKPIKAVWKKIRRPRK